MRIFALVSTLALAVWLPSPAHADDDVSGAAKAFSQAQEVMLSGDVARAADLFELADDLSPSAPALRNATRARFQIQHFATAATHAAELLRRYPSDKESRAVAEAILTKLTPELAQVDLTCSSACMISVDGKALAPRPRESYSFFTKPGARAVVATFEDGRKTTDTVTALINHTSALRLEAPPKAPEPPAPKVELVAPPPQPAPVTRARPTGGISRLWFVGGAVLTLGAGTAAALSGMQTLQTRDEIREAVSVGAQSEAVDLYNQGRSQQLRTNILLGASAAAGIATIALAVFTNWSGESADVTVAPGSSGASLMYRSRF
jgi:hypothetical protein